MNRVAVVSTIVATTFAGFGATPAAAQPPAKAHREAVTLHVGPGAFSWRSPERFRGADLIQIETRVNGRATFAEIVSSCVHFAYGGGVAVRLSTCGTRPHLIARGVSTVRSRIRVVYTWAPPER